MSQNLLVGRWLHADSLCLVFEQFLHEAVLQATTTAPKLRRIPETTKQSFKLLEL